MPRAAFWEKAFWGFAGFSLLLRKIKGSMKKTFFLFFFLTALVPYAMGQNWDINTVHHINNWGGTFIHDYSNIVSKTEPYVAVGVPVAMALAGWWKHDDALLKDALYVGSTVAGAFVLSYGMKYVFDRQRPYVAYPDRVHPYSFEDTPSFPSGHTASAFALATSLCIRYPKWYVIAPSALWATSVGISRMYEGVHYPTDVMAGAFVGAGCAVGSIYLSKWLNGLLFGK